MITYILFLSVVVSGGGVGNGSSVTNLATCFTYFKIILFDLIMFLSISYTVREVEVIK